MVWMCVLYVYVYGDPLNGEELKVCSKSERYIMQLHSEIFRVQPWEYMEMDVFGSVSV